MGSMNRLDDQGSERRIVGGNQRNTVLISAGGSRPAALSLRPSVMYFVLAAWVQLGLAPPDIWAGDGIWRPIFLHRDAGSTETGFVDRLLAAYPRLIPPGSTTPAEVLAGRDGDNNDADWVPYEAWLVALFKREGRQRSTSTSISTDWAAVSTSVAWHDDDPLDPTPRTPWQANESLRLPVAGPLFLFGQFGATASLVEQPLPRWESKYGVGLKLKPGIVDEVQMRGGPLVRSDETGRPMRNANGAEHTELFLEAVTKLGLPVVGPLNVEYTSTAVPAATPGDRGQLNQDFRLARPLPGGGQVHLGARYRMDDPAAAAPWVERTQLYLGLQLKR